MDQDAPLNGIKCVDVSQGIAGPIVGMLLAQHGADVVKVEPPGAGDWSRSSAESPGGNAELSVLANIGKRSICLDLKTPGGHQALSRLTETADVFIEGFRPSVIGKLGFGYEALSGRRPQLIYLSVSGFGQTGPMAKRPGLDPVIQALSGMMFDNRDAQGAPRSAWSIPVDITTGLLAFQAVAMALYGRRDSGRGCFIDASLLHAGAWLSAYPMLLAHANGGEPAPPPPSANCVETSDGWMMVVAQGHRDLTDLCNAVERPDLIDHPLFRDVRARRADPAQFRAIISELFKARSTSDWSERLVAFGIPHGRVNRPIDVLAEPQVEALQLYSILEQPDCARAMPIPALPGARSLKSGESRAVAPSAGMQTAAILRELGYGDREIGDLLASGAAMQRGAEPADLARPMA